MAKKTDKNNATKSAKKSKKKDELNPKDLDEKMLAPQVDENEEDLLLIDDDDYGTRSEDIDEDVEFLMSDDSDDDDENPKRGSSGLGGGMSAAEQQAQQDNAKTAFEGITASNLKNFRHHPDIENFYRFVFDNDLRIEALGILDETVAARKAKKALKDKKEKVH